MTSDDEMRAVARATLELELIESGCVNEALRLILRDLSIITAASDDEVARDYPTLYFLAIEQYMADAKSEQIASALRGLVSMIEGMMGTLFGSDDPSALFDHVDSLLNTGMQERLRMAQELKDLK